MKKFLIMVLVMASLAGCRTENKQEAQPVKNGFRVTVAEVKKERLKRDLGYSGTVEPYQTIPLSFQSAGTVEKVLVNAGDEVRKGQLLASVDATDARNMYKITVAKYNQAKDAYERLKKVYENGSLAEVKWVEMEANMQQAISSLEISENNLEKCNLYSPVNGIVGRRNIEPGMSSISVGSSPLEIVDIRKVYVKISVPENEVVLFSPGLAAYFRVAALNDLQCEGKVANVSPVADRIARTYEVRILVDNAGLRLKPGMVCDVRVENSAEADVLLIPNHCVVNNGKDGQFVFVVDEEHLRVRKQAIRTGQYVGSNMEVLSGLSGGELIVNGGKEKLTDNCNISL